MIKTSFLEMQVEICGSCSLQCMHCSSWPTRHIKDINYDFVNILKLANNIQGVKHINITGGEPLLCNNLHSYLSLLKSAPNLSVGLFSSGIIQRNDTLHCIDREHAKLLLSDGVSTVALSIYHTKDDVHDTFTGVYGSLQLTMSSAKYLLSVGIKVSIHIVINQHNFKCIDSIINDLSKLNLSEIRLLRITKSGNAVNNWDEIGIDRPIQDDLLYKIFNVNQYPQNLSIAGFPSLVACRRFEGARNCQAGINLIYITADGFVFPCASLRNSPSHCIGSINDLDSLYHYLSSIKSTHYEYCLAG